jgi:micrococcal nuclease
MRIAVLPLLFPACIVALPASHAGTENLIRGPVEAEVERVIDGDTLAAIAHVWPGHSVRVSVRIRGIDAPEMRSRCAAERAAAEAARRALEELVGGAPVLISNIGGDKYYGRVVADVVVHDGREAADALIGASHARRYAGGERVAYC